ncbi:MAG TPA: hypothetical protein PLQ97_00180 [Myxococcota bacterium]|nr:hypothetical protein [Myxococcota bacterium]HQK49590.1 hypothetical protein [Myxococcota bacterium]
MKAVVTRPSDPASLAGLPGAEKTEFLDAPVFGVVTDDVSAGAEDTLQVVEVASVDGLLLLGPVEAFQDPACLRLGHKGEDPAHLSARDTLPGMHIAPSIA